MVRPFAIVVVLLFSLSAVRVTTVLPSARCLRCAPDCPTHQHKLPCHAGSLAAAAPHADCQGLSPRAPGLMAAGCTGKPDGFTASDHPAVLPVMLDVGDAPIALQDLARPVPLPAEVTLDPPFHPPWSTVVGI